jgi:hypothetical protein
VLPEPIAELDEVATVGEGLELAVRYSDIVR